jgi:tetratricopeptide (TPR) repeat protein
VIALRGIGTLLGESGATDQAMVFLSKAATLAPHDPITLLNLGAAATAVGALDLAIDALERAVALAPTNELAWHSLARTLNVAGKPERGMVIALRLKARNPAHIGARMNIVRSLAQLGRLETAETEALEITQKWPDRAAGYITLAPLRRFEAGDPVIGKAEQVAASGRVEPHEAGDLLFALAKMYDDSGRWDDAFARFAEANARSPGQYDSADWNARARAMMTAYDKGRIAARCEHGFQSDKPVLVVGMPRSGTTLVESILMAHPDFASVGESPALTLLAAEATQFAPPARDLNTLVRTLGPEGTLFLGQRYVSALERSAAGHGDKRIIDKMPHNFWNLGLAALATPRARILHVTRSPLATAFSCWTQNFNHAQPYASRFEDIASHYELYQRMMRHWSEALGDRIMAIAYEDIVDDPEAAAKRMFEFIGVSSDDIRLDERRHLNVVTTASVWQVRQAIHGRSKERWRQYREHLDPLKRALERSGIEAA